MNFTIFYLACYMSYCFLGTQLLRFIVVKFKLLEHKKIQNYLIMLVLCLMFGFTAIPIMEYRPFNTLYYYIFKLEPKL
jgi:hypothetical protein